MEAPGTLGEARLVAREIKTLLLDGTPADDVIVAVRDLAVYADLLREVFSEYGLPLQKRCQEPFPSFAHILGIVSDVRQDQSCQHWFLTTYQFINYGILSVTSTDPGA
jgi:superfamily I DNA/RNA helicase